MTDCATGTPRYRRIADDLTRAIIEGRYAVGSPLPTEMDLCERFKVSRNTVREALRKLQEEGLIARRQGAGTVVTSAERHPTYAIPLGSLSDMMQFLGETRIHVVAIVGVTVDRQLAAMLGCCLGESWIRVESYRTLEGSDKPLSWTEFYIPAAYREIVDAIGKRVGPVYQVIEERFGVRITEIQQEMVGCLVEERMAGYLSVAADHPALQVKHRLFGEDKSTLEVAVSVYPAERFRHSLRIRLTGRT